MFDVLIKDYGEADCNYYNIIKLMTGNIFINFMVLLVYINYRYLYDIAYFSLIYMNII
jgi:hypothetical protein